MTNLSVMMNWYAPIDDIVEKECVDCGLMFEVKKNVVGVAKRCPTCAQIQVYEYHHKMQQVERDPEIELVKAVIQSALKEKDREFIQNNGIQLWLRAVGIGITPSMNKRIESMGR